MQRKQKTGNKQKIDNKMEDLNSNISVITLK